MSYKRIYSEITRSYHYSTEAKEIEEGQKCAECKVFFDEPEGRAVLCIDCYSAALVKSGGKEPRYPRATVPELEPERTETSDFVSEREMKRRRNSLGIPGVYVHESNFTILY